MTIEQTLHVVAGAISMVGLVWALVQLFSSRSRALPLLAMILALCVLTAATSAWAVVGGTVLLASVCFAVLGCYQAANRPNNGQRAMLVNTAAFAATTAIIVILTAAFGLGFTTPNARTVPIECIHFITDLYCTVIISIAVGESYRAGSSATTSAVRVCVWVSSAGLLIMAFVNASLASVAANWLLHHQYLAGLAAAARLGMHIGSSVFLLGLFALIVVAGVRSVRHTRQQREDHADLLDLWALLFATFSEIHTKRGYTSRLKDPFKVRARRRERSGREIECWDGLQRIAPFMPPEADPSNVHQLAHLVITACEVIQENAASAPADTPSARPIIGKQATSAKEEHQALLTLSRAVTQQLHDRELEETRT